MSNISLVEAKLPPGFRFHPRDEELVCDYLMKKVASTDTLQLMIEVDLNKCEPWDIPETARVGGKEWYFYSQRDRKYAIGSRKNRATASGYWKATGKDRTILSKDTLVGMRKTLVFYQGRAPKGRKTDWVMHEFRLEGPLSPPNITTLKEDWVLCRVLYKNREIITKPSSMGSCSYNDTGSLSLPPLMDSYINFDQNQPNLDEIYYDDDDDDDDEQVPCFSINLSQNQSNPTSLKDMMITNHHYHMEPNLIPTTKNLTSSSSADEQIPMNNVASCLDSFPPDKKVINAVLNHLTQLDTYLNVKESPSSAEGSSYQSYLSGLALPNIWN